MDDARPFWLVSLFQSLMIAVVAYIVAIFIELVLVRISEMPHGPLWTPEFQGPFLFIMTIAMVALLSIPYWMKEWDAGIRTFSMFSSAMLLAMAVFTQTGQFDPNAPLQYLSDHVFLPMKERLGI
jgi:hypothetical protein